MLNGLQTDKEPRVIMTRRVLLESLRPINMKLRIWPWSFPKGGKKKSIRLVVNSKKFIHYKTIDEGTSKNQIVTAKSDAYASWHYMVQS